MKNFSTTAARNVLRALDDIPETLRSRKIFRIIPESRNEKTGRVFQTYSSASTCPTNCAFKRYGGCYACAINTRKVWQTADRDDFAALALQLIANSNGTAAPGAFIRHNVAGDIARLGTSNIDDDLLLSLARLYGATGAKAVSYTHCRIDGRAAVALHRARNFGFTVNVSCEALAQLEIAADFALPAVLAVPEDEEIPARAAGRRVVQCPAQTKGIACEKCRLCTWAERNCVIAFKAHGYAHKLASAAIKRARAEIEY